jgi:hypothetical protein
MRPCYGEETNASTTVISTADESDPSRFELGLRMKRMRRRGLGPWS